VKNKRGGISMSGVGGGKIGKKVGALKGEGGTKNEGLGMDA